MNVVHAVGDALTLTGTMTWQIAWSLILGFALSAVVQAVVRREAIVKTLGDNRPVSPPPPDAPVDDSFIIAVGNPNNLVSPGVTGTEFENACLVPALSQDVDGHVTVLTGEQDAGLHEFSMTSGPTNVDSDFYLCDEDCSLITSYGTAAANEAGSIPSGTAYILTSLYAGAAADITLTVTDTE